MKEGESTGSLKRVNWDTISDRRLIKVTALVIRKDAVMRRSTDLCRESVCVSACYTSVSEDSLMKSASVISTRDQLFSLLRYAEISTSCES